MKLLQTQHFKQILSLVLLLCFSYSIIEANATTNFSYSSKKGFTSKIVQAFQRSIQREMTTMGAMLSSGSVSSRVSTGSDDAEENLSSGSVSLTSSDLELTSDGGTNQVVGMRFNNINIPQGATITSAYIEFEVDEVDSGTTNLTFSAEDIDDAPVFTTSNGNISARTPTSNSTPWNNISAWSSVSAKQQTPDLSLIVQEVVDREGWTYGNSIAVLVTGTGERTAKSYNGENANAPLLVVNYSTHNSTCSSNALSNPDFESGFTGWSNTNSVLTDDAYSGDQAVVNTGSNGGISQDYAGTPGETYTLEAYGRKTGTAVPEFGIKFFDASWNDIGGRYVSVESTDWELYRIAVTAPANTVHVQAIGWNSNGTGNAYFDDFCFDTWSFPPVSTTNTFMEVEPSFNRYIFSVDDSGSTSNWLDYDKSDMVLEDNGDGTLTLKGNVIMGRDADWHVSNGVECGVQDGWYFECILTDRQTWNEFQGSYVVNPSCPNAYTDLDYYAMSGTLTGLGCNAGRTINITGANAGYRMQIGVGGNSHNCGYGMSTWITGDENGTQIGGDLYANLDETSYLALRRSGGGSTCTLTNPYPGFPIDFLNNNSGWIDYNLGNDLTLTDNGDGTQTITGSITDGTPVDFGSGANGTSCGATDGWTLNLTLSDKMTWTEFQNAGGSANVHANCNADIADLDYWDISGTLTGTGCNSGRTLTITGPKSPYRLQIGYGANNGDGNCDFGMSTWFDLNENGTNLNADIYAFLDESCYNSTTPPATSNCPNDLSNSEFDGGTDNWDFYVNGGSGTFTVDNTSQLSGSNSAEINITSTNGTEWHLQLAQPNKTLIAGTTYAIEFDAKAAAARNISASLQLQVNPWTGYWYESVALTTTGTRYAYEFTPNTTVNGQVSLVFNIGQDSETVYIDNIVFGEVCPEDEVTINSTTVSNCIDQPLQDVATVDVNVSWATPAPSNTIEFIYGDKTEYLDISSLSSPQTVQLVVAADGSNNNALDISFSGSASTYSTTYNAPVACSNDAIACNILYLCGEEKPYDGDPWDHGWVEYLDAVNGAFTVTPILTKADGSGMGTYDVNNPSTFVNVTLTDYDLIIVSATTENYIANDLVNVLKDTPVSVLNSNYLIIDDLGMSNSSGGYTFETAAYTDNTTYVEMYNYDNVNPDYNYVFTRGDYLANADAYLWAYNNNQSSGVNGYFFANDATDAMPGVANTHGNRVYLGYHMNGLYANPVNGGALPAPVSTWFDPITHLTLEGKDYFDQAIVLAAAGCSSTPIIPITINSTTVSNCIDQPLQDVATVDMNISWTSASSSIIEFTHGNKTEYLDITSLSSPYTMQFVVPADGSTNNNVDVNFYGSSNKTSTTYNAPAACSADEIACNILFICGNNKPEDGDSYDHGFINYLDAMNGSKIVTPAFAQYEASGYGLYDPNNPGTALNINLDDYDLVVASPTIGNNFASDLINDLVTYEGGILSMLRFWSDDLGMASGDGWVNVKNEAYIDNTNSITIYNYDNIDPQYDEIVSIYGYNASAGSEAFLWSNQWDAGSDQNGIFFYFDDKDALPGISSHGHRVQLGYFMEGLYANAANGGALPAPASSYFDPVVHLTLEGKSYLDQAIVLAASGCGVVCGTDNDCITVNSIGDKGDTNPGDGICATEDCECTLRAAIEEANALAGADEICFDIAGAGPHTIIPMSDYESLSEQVNIKGYTQSGSIVATTNTPATINIEIDGSNLTSAQGIFHTTANDCEISGMAINGHDGALAGAAITFQSDNNHVWGCHIGTNPAGTVAIQNSRGIRVWNADNCVIGGSTPAERNVISGNQYMGISLEKNGFANMCDNTLIQGNFIGTDAAGTSALGNLQDGIDGGHSRTTSIINNVISGNGQDGIEVDGGSNGTQLSSGIIQGNMIGTDASGTLDLGNGFRGILVRWQDDMLIGGLNAGEENHIVHNDATGITVHEEETDNVRILRNIIYDNANLGIDLSNGFGADYVTSNDANDSDTGANDLLNFPSLDEFKFDGSDWNYSFDLDLPAGDYRIELFKNTIADNSNHGEGEVFIGAININHPGTGVMNYSGVFIPLVAVNVGEFIAATTTACTDGTCTDFTITSEFSNLVEANSCGDEICGNNIDDDCDGDTDCDDSDCNPFSLTTNETTCTNNGDGTFTAQYDLIVDWVATTHTGNVEVTWNGTNVGTFDISSTTAPHTINLNIPADGMGEEVFTANFVGVTCVTDLTIDAPTACPTPTGNPSGEACGTLTTTEIGGTVFLDNDFDGTMNAGVDTIGLRGFRVDIYDRSNTLIQTVYTDIDGNYIITGLDANAKYRIEITPPFNQKDDYVPTVNGADNNTSINFTKAGECVNAAFGVPAADSPVEIGDAIWIDYNRDGIQNADEEPLAGVIITLYDATTGNILAQDITDNDGAYHFNDAALTAYAGSATQLTPNTNYIIVITGATDGGWSVADSKLTVDGYTFGVSPANQGADTELDSDATIGNSSSPLNTVTDGYIFATVTTGDPGIMDRSIDFGLLIDEICDNGIDDDRDGLSDCADPDCAGSGVAIAADDDNFDVFCPGLDYTGNVLSNDQNYGVNPTITITTAPTAGVVTMDNTGTFTYEPNAYVCNTDQFVYEVCNNLTGCCVSATATINYSDTQFPTLIGVPEDDIIFCDEIVPRAPYIQVTDNCSGLSLDFDESDTQGVDGCSLHDYTITRTWVASDACGNQTTDTQIVEVMDVTAPDIYRIYTLPNGKKMVAGVMENVTERWKTIQLPIDFPTKPVIFTQVTSVNEASTVTARIRNTSISQFEMRLQEEEAADNDHQPETVAWVAVEVGTNSIDNSFEVAKLDVNETFANVSFVESYSPGYPIALAGMQTTRDDDPATVRYNRFAPTGMDLIVQEETSVSADVTHTAEEVAYWTIATPGANSVSDFIDSNGDVIGEKSFTAITDTWNTITFNHTYHNPVLLATGLTYQDTDPVTVRVRNVTPTGFEMRLEEWDSQDGTHPVEYLGWVVIEGSLPLVASANCDAVPAAPVGGIEIIAVDNCDISVPLTFNESENFTDCANRFIERSWVATDECGNATVYTKTIQVADPESPSFTVPADVTISCNADIDDLALTGDITNVSDNCSTSLTPFYTDDVSALSSCNQSGEVIRTWRVTDECGQAFEQTQVITIDDSDCGGCEIYVNTTDDIDDGECTHEHCSLREAINESNNSAGLDTIRFLIPGTDVQTIIPLTPLPPVTEEVFIDATTQPQASCPDNLLIELDGSALLGLDEHGLEILADNVTIKGFIINRFPANGIAFAGANSGHVQCSYLGTGANGVIARPNAKCGVALDNNTNNVIIGTNEDGIEDANERNVISGNTLAGVSVQGGDDNLIVGNQIGTDKDGVNPVPNGTYGVEITGGSKYNRIGGKSATTENIISGNTQSGIRISSTYTDFATGEYTGNDTIQYNRIGWSANDTPLGNGENGVLVELANDIHVTNNKISTNSDYGIQIKGAKVEISDNLLQDNDESGIVFEIHYGSDNNPENEVASPDDILPLVTISSNTLTNNCTDPNNNCAEITALDVPLDPVNNDNGTTIYNNNTYTNNTYPALTQLWYGAVEFMNDNRPAIAPFPVIVESSNNGPVYNLDANAQTGSGFRKTILHGQTGINSTDVTTWTLFTQYELAEDGTVTDFSPFTTTECSNFFSFDGDATTDLPAFDLGFIGEGIATKSPDAYGASYSVNRYQMAQLEDCSDRDRDGSVDEVDLDDDNDGIADVDEGTEDLDGDGIPNDKDLDSDNDGIPDIIEAGFNDQNGDGLVDNLGLPGWDDDNDGWADGFDANDEDPSLSASNTFDPTTFTADRDGDGAPNYQDLDSENDGLPDLIEAGGVDTNGDGQVDYPVINDPSTMIDNDNDGFTDLYDPDYNGSPGADDTTLPLVTYNGNQYSDATGNRPDADNDNVPNFWDLDSDNDGLPDLIEQNGVDTDGNGVVDAAEWVDANNNGFHDDYENQPLILTEADDGAGNVRPVDNDNDGTRFPKGDFDADDKPNAYDLESDGDGINDLRETAGANADTDNDGVIDIFNDSNDNGCDDDVEALPLLFTEDDGANDDGRPEDSADADQSAYGTDMPDGTLGVVNGEPDVDNDGDSWINAQDLDSDNDLLADNIEDKNTDGITDVDETDPYNEDTDDDLLTDGVEDENKDGIYDEGPETDPLNPDTDGDSLEDGTEDSSHDGYVNGTESDPRDPCDPYLSAQCIGVRVSVRVHLFGALISSPDGLMRDDLRQQDFLPMKEPYSALESFAHYKDGGGETTTQDVFDVIGDDAIVDWVMVELRNPLDSADVVATRSGLLQRDGDVVDMDGVSPLYFETVVSGSYFVSVRHRNHLGVCTSSTQVLTEATTVVDFTLPTTLVFGDDSRAYIQDKWALWGGDLSSDGNVIYQGPQNDIFEMLLKILTNQGNTQQYYNYIIHGYHDQDFDLNGNVIYQGPDNDRSKVLFDIILAHPHNVNGFPNFIINTPNP